MKKINVWEVALESCSNWDAANERFDIHENIESHFYFTKEEAEADYENEKSCLENNNSVALFRYKIELETVQQLLDEIELDSTIADSIKCH